MAKRKTPGTSIVPAGLSLEDLLLLISTATREGNNPDAGRAPMPLRGTVQKPGPMVRYRKGVPVGQRAKGPATAAAALPEGGLKGVMKYLKYLIAPAAILTGGSILRERKKRKSESKQLDALLQMLAGIDPKDQARGYLDQLQKPGLESNFALSGLLGEDQLEALGPRGQASAALSFHSDRERARIAVDKLRVSAPDVLSRMMNQELQGGGLWADIPESIGSTGAGVNGLPPEAQDQLALQAMIGRMTGGVQNNPFAAS